MLYLVNAELSPAYTSAPRETFNDILSKVVRPSVEQFLQLMGEGRIVGGGVISSTTRFVLILDLPSVQSHMDVRRFLVQFPIFPHCVWEVTPLESFEDWQ